MEQPVQALIKPTVTGYRRTWLHNWSESSSDNEGWGEVEASGEQTSETTGTANSTTTTPIYDAFGFPRTLTQTHGAAETLNSALSSSSSSTSSYSISHADAISHGAAETLEPELEERATAVHGLENIRHMAVSRLRSIPPQNAVVKGSAEPSFDISTFFIDDVLVASETVTSFKQRVFESSPYTLLTKDVQSLLQERFDDLTNFRAATNHAGILDFDDGDQLS